MAGDVESLHGGLSLLDPLVDRILVDTMSQQQGWLRVYGKKNRESGDSVSTDPAEQRVSWKDSAGSLASGYRAESQVTFVGRGRGHSGHRPAGWLAG